MLLAAACVVAPAAAQAPPSDTGRPAGPALPEAQRRLDTTRQRLDERRETEKVVTADVERLQAERQRLHQSLAETARLIQRSEGQLTAIEARQSELEAQEKLLRGSLAQRHDVIVKLLAAMQRMGRNPPPAMITRREDALQMVRSAMMLATAFPELRGKALELAGRLSELARVMADIKSETDKLKGETQRLGEAQIRLAQLNEARRLSLAERQAELDAVRREAAEIAKSVTDINELITRLDKAVTAHTGRPTAPAAAPPAAPAPPAEVALQMPDPGARPKAPDAPAIARPPERPGPAFELAPKGNKVAALTPGLMKPAIPFAKARASLHLPAQGRRILAFGDKTHNGRSKGLVLETRHGAQVTASADGWVVFAGEFRSFGQLLIVNAGDGYHMLLAGMSQIDVQLGEFVLAGQPVGLMAVAPKGSKPKGTEGAPVLYVELRKDGQPIDSQPWWVPESSKKVQG